MGEKPFGIDRPANDAILACCAEHPEVFVRCASEFPFFPAVQRIGGMIEAGAFGRIIEVNAGFLHGSDLDPQKPINWKRQVQFCGRYGCMGDLGLHVCHVPLRAGWIPRSVRAVLSNIVPQRPDGRGGTSPCDTWDNATLLCDATDPGTGEPFPLTIKTQRIAPGETNTWRLEVLGTQASARFSTKDPKRLEVLRYCGGEQVWGRLDMGQQTAFKSITGGDLRVRLLGRDFADVGRLPLRAGARPWAQPLRRVRDARGDRPEPSNLYRRLGVPREGDRGGRVSRSIPHTPCAVKSSHGV